MKNYKRKIVTGALLGMLAVPVLADDFTMVTNKAVGENLSLALNANVRATLTWDDKTASQSEVLFDGDFVQIPVKGKKLSVSTKQTVRSLYCGGNSLSELNIFGLKKLTTLVCDDNDIKLLTLVANENLEELSCQRNQLASLSLDKNRKVARVNVAQNPLKTLTVSRGGDLNYLNVSHTNLTRCYVGQSAKLNMFLAQKAQLTNLDLPASVEVVCADQNELTTFNGKATPKVTMLWLADNKIQSLDLGDLQKLEDFVAERNELRKVDVSLATRSTLKNFFVAENSLAYNSLPTASSSVLVNVQPQRPFALNVTVKEGEPLNLDSLISRNAWRARVSPKVVWKYKKDNSVVPATAYTVSSATYTFKEPIGEIFAEVTSSKYPNFTLTIAGVHIGNKTGIESQELEDSWSVNAINKGIQVTCNKAMHLTVVRMDGVVVLSEHVAPGTYTWNLPQGIYLVNKKKIYVK